MKTIAIMFLSAIFAFAQLSSATEAHQVERTMTINDKINDKGRESSLFFRIRASASTPDNTGALFGVDVASPLTLEQTKCLVNDYKASYFIPRGYRSIAALDTNLQSNVENAWRAGFESVDTYIFPCFHCRDKKSATTQMRELEKSLILGAIDIEIIWLDIEGPEYWSTDVYENRDFFEEMLEVAASTKRRYYGIYSSKSQWDAIFGADYTVGSTFPLWYAHYDNVRDFSDFVPFGGFNKPAMKQFAGTYTICGVQVDGNFFPPLN